MTGTVVQPMVHGVTGASLDLVRTGAAAGGLDEGPLRYATADGFTAEIARSSAAPGRLTVKVFRRGGEPDYLRADAIEEALALAADCIREWRRGGPSYPLTTPPAA